MSAAVALGPEPGKRPAADPVTLAPPADGGVYLWYRSADAGGTGRWLGQGRFPDSTAAEHFASADPTRRGREYVILPDHLVPHPGYSEH